jgi:hypothetical protein
MMRRFFLIALLALSAAPAAAPIAGAASWTAPQTVSAPHEFVGPVVTTTSFDGSTVAVWPWQDNVGNDAVGGWAEAARPSSLQPVNFGGERVAPAGTQEIGAFARSQVLAVSAQATGQPGPTGAILYNIGAAFSPVGGTFGRPRTLATAPVLGGVHLATSGSTALVTWIEVTRTSTGGIRRVVRAVDRRNGRWGKAYTLSGTGRADTLTAAASTNGDQVVVFARDGKVLTRVRRHGHSWGAITTLATQNGSTQWQLAAGIDARGQVRVVWRRHQLSRSGVPGIQAIETAARLVGRSTFTRPQTITANGASGFRLAAIPQGWAVADVEHDQPILHRTTGGSQFAPGQAAAPAQSGTRGADVTWSSVGGITVAWVQPLNNATDGIARAASYTNNNAWTPVEDVSPAETVHDVRLATDARAGQPIAIWTARPSGQPPSVVRAATRRP